MGNFRTKECTEGLIRFGVPVYEREPDVKMPVFYNPVMEFRRDVSVAALKIISKSRKKHIELLDGLAGTGISGLRYAKEAGGDMTVTINDHSPPAFGQILENIRLNDVGNAVANRRDANSLMAERFFDIIDLDPFGTPVPFLDMALRSLKLGGYLFITATDTAVLFGRHGKTCRRRYMAENHRLTYSHELGLRILIGYCARAAARFDMAIKPLLCYYSDHYYRLILSTKVGSDTADACLKNLGFVLHNQKTGERRVIHEFDEWKSYRVGTKITLDDAGLDGDTLVSGPLWAGAYTDGQFLGDFKIEDYFGTKKRLEKMLTLWKEEQQAPPLFYTISEVASRFRSESPKLDDMVARLSDAGYSASRTHISPTGFRTDAPVDVIRDALKTGYLKTAV